MERTILAFSLMALIVTTGIVVGLYLRHNIRERSVQRQIARHELQRQARAVAAGPE